MSDKGGKRDTAPSSAPSQRKPNTIDSLSGCTAPGWWKLKQNLRLLLMAAPMMAWGHIQPFQAPTPDNHSIKSPVPLKVRQRAASNDDDSGKQPTQENF